MNNVHDLNTFLIALHFCAIIKIPFLEQGMHTQKTSMINWESFFPHRQILIKLTASFRKTIYTLSFFLSACHGIYDNVIELNAKK
jgi:hypothetical protein